MDFISKDVMTHNFYIYEFSFVQIHLGLTFKIITYQDLILYFQKKYHHFISFQLVQSEITTTLAYLTILYSDALFKL